MTEESQPKGVYSDTGPTATVNRKRFGVVARWSESSLAKPLFVVVAAAFVLSFFKHAVIDPWDYMGGDFNLFYDSARKMAQGKSPYPDVILNTSAEESTGEAWGTYIYPPLFARVLTPFTVLPAFWAKKAYLLVCIVLYFWLLYPRHSQVPTGRIGQAVEGMILLGWGPTIETLRLGQSNFVPLFLMFFAWRLLRERNGEEDPATAARRQFAAGLLMGIASTVKLTPLLILPVLVVTFRIRIAIGFVLGGVASLLLTGPQTSLQYITKVFPSMSDFPSLRYCPSIHVLVVRTFDQLAASGGIAAEWLEKAPWIGVAVSGALYSALILFFFLKRRRFTDENLLLIACFLPPLFAGALFHHYTLAILPVLVAARRLLAQSLESVRRADTKPDSWVSPPIRLLLAALALVPIFLYWFSSRWFCSAVGYLTTFSHSTQVVVGASIAFLLLLPLFMTPAQKGR